MTQGSGALQNRRDKRFRLAVGSFVEDSPLNNYVEIITCAGPHARRGC